jgi:soluble lytic murein transglycosylase-like protein
MMIFHDVPLACINEAAMTYQVPATMIVSVIKMEDGKNGEISRNPNGTYDMGVMQINSIWLTKLKEKGISEESVKSDPCTNVKVGTWILAQGIANGDGWVGVGNYHSYTPKHNARYREKIKRIFTQYISVSRMV